MKPGEALDALGRKIKTMTPHKMRAFGDKQLRVGSSPRGEKSVGVKVKGKSYVVRFGREDDRTFKISDLDKAASAILKWIHKNG